MAKPSPYGESKTTLRLEKDSGGYWLRSTTEFEDRPPRPSHSAFFPTYRQALTAARTMIGVLRFVNPKAQVDVLGPTGQPLLPALGRSKRKR